MAPRRRAQQGTARVRVTVQLSELPAGRFYAREKRKPGPKRKLLAKQLRTSPPAVQQPRRSYTVNYKLRVLSWLQKPSIPCGPTRLREPTLAEAANRFKIPVANLGKWQKEERQGKYLEISAMACRIGGGGRRRKWAEMERVLYDQFRHRRAEGKVVWRSWFRYNAKKIYSETYTTTNVSEFRFSNGWFRGFLSWHKITLRAITNKASQLPSDYIDTIISWMRFNRRNSQQQNENGIPESDEEAEVGRYRLSNICNMDQTPLPFEYLSGRRYHQQGDKTIGVQGSKQTGWDKRQATIQLTIFADGIPTVKPLVFFCGQGIGASIQAEKEHYDKRVVVKFNPKAYANSTSIVEWLDDQVIPVLDGRPILMALDMFGSHKTEEVLDTRRAHDITLSVIPGGCTGLVQPLDVSIYRPFKDILKVSIDQNSKQGR